MIFETVAGIMARYINCDAGDIKEDSTLESLQLDSLDMVEIVMSVEEEYGVSIDELEGVNSVADLVALIEEKVGK